LSKKKNNNHSSDDGFSFRLDPNIDEALRRAVSDALSKMTTLTPGAPITYSINIRVGENGVPSAMQPPADGRNAQRSLRSEARDPMIEVVERDGSITVIAEVTGIDRNALRVRATPRTLEVCSTGNGKAVDRISVINLPKETDPASATARYRNGVLEITVDKGKGPATRFVRIE
jgi:HSP20 family molecular chaperone IbpA